MREYKLTKQAFKKLKKLSTSDPKLASQIADHITELRQDLISGESLSGYSNFKKIRVRKFRIIYTIENEVLLIAILDKREVVYDMFAQYIKNNPST